MPHDSRHALWAVTVAAAPFGLYLTFLALSTSHYFQRHFLYAHRVYPFWQDPNKPQKWGFAKNQVTPFSIETSDGESIYAWHVLPLRTYAEFESELIAQPSEFCKDYTSSATFRILREDPDAKVVISLHGNAGHLPNAVRSPHFHLLSDTTRYHVLSIDYRGYGKSSGSPSEAGLINDAYTLLTLVLRDASISPDRIVLLGHSLGTAVTAGIAERFAREGVDFAGIVLVAGFSSLPAMLSGYAIAGWIPVLRPLTVWPWLLGKFMGRVADKWETAARMKKVVEIVRSRRETGGHLRLSLVHARNDWDIPCHEDDKIFEAAVRGLIGDDEDIDDQQFLEMKDRRTVGRGQDAFVTEWREGNITVRQELFPHGGHNNIMLSAPMPMEVMRSFDTCTR